MSTNSTTPMSTAQSTLRTATGTATGPVDLPEPDTYPWPTLDTTHDPEYLATNDPTPTDKTTLEIFGVDRPDAPAVCRVTFDTRPATTQRDLDVATAVAQYRRGSLPDRIRTPFADDPESVAAHLRTAGVLEPWDDPRALAHLYHDYDHTLSDLESAFGNGRSAETIREHMDRFGIDRRHNAEVQLLEDMDTETFDALVADGGVVRPEPTAEEKRRQEIRAALIGAARAHEVSVDELSIPDYEHYAAAVDGPDLETVVEAMDGWQAAKRAAAAVREGGDGK